MYVVVWDCFGSRAQSKKKKKKKESLFAKIKCGGTVENKVNAVHSLVKLVSQKHTS